MHPTLSAVICTLNRCEMLRDAIASVAHQTLDRAEYEIIVVDNGSTDATRKTIEDLAMGLSNLRYVCEPKRGLSHARNRGAAVARGDVVAFTDDDAVAAESWLESLLGGYRAVPDACAVGGRIDLIWPSGRPAWFPPTLECYLAQLDLGGDRLVIRYPTYPFGCNMSFRRRTLLNYGGFSPRLGRKGNGLLSSEETEIFYRLGRDNMKVLYEPTALVNHRVAAGRLSWTWVLQRCFAQGRSDRILEQLADEEVTHPHLLHGTRSTLEDALRLSLGYLLGRHDPASMLLASSNVARYSGYTCQGLRHALARASRTRPAARSRRALMRGTRPCGRS